MLAWKWMLLLCKLLQWWKESWWDQVCGFCQWNRLLNWKAVPTCPRPEAGSLWKTHMVITTSSASEQPCEVTGSTFSLKSPLNSLWPLEGSAQTSGSAAQPSHGLPTACSSAQLLACGTGAAGAPLPGAGGEEEEPGLSPSWGGGRHMPVGAWGNNSLFVWLRKVLAARGAKNRSGLLQPTVHRVWLTEPGSAFSFPHLALRALQFCFLSRSWKNQWQQQGKWCSWVWTKGLFLRWYCQHLLLGKVRAGALCIWTVSKLAQQTMAFLRAE